jgi:thymidylate synthase
MSKIDQTYHGLCETVFSQGREYLDTRRGAMRLQIPTYTITHLFKDGFPALSTKDLYWHGIKTELAWFLNGDNDIKFLRDRKVTIWDSDAYNYHVKHTEKPLSPEEFQLLGEGSVGQNYSRQWRAYAEQIDQITKLINEMRVNIMSSYLVVNAWNPTELDQTALAPCHYGFQVVGVPLTIEEKKEWVLKNKIVLNTTEAIEAAALEADTPTHGFMLSWDQRSSDVFLGIPFNIASYALMAKKLEMLTGHVALGIQGNLKCVHFYDNQYDAAKELLLRDPFKHENCELTYKNEPLIYAHNHTANIDEFMASIDPKDFILSGYTSDPAIKVKMLAPTSI